MMMMMIIIIIIIIIAVRLYAVDLVFCIAKIYISTKRQ